MIKLLLLAFIIQIYLRHINCKYDEKTANFISDYFSARKVQFLSVYNCWNTKSIIKLQKPLMKDYGFRANFLSMNNGRKPSFFFFSQYGFIVDLDCGESQTFLETNPNLTRWDSYYSNMFKWLLITERKSYNEAFEMFKKVELRMDSDISVVFLNNDSIKVFDTYHTGLGINRGRLIMKELVKYDFTRRQFVAVINETNAYNLRRNMTGLFIRTTNVVTKNYTDAREHLLDRKNKDDAISKCTFAVFVALQEIHNFTDATYVTTLWFGAQLKGIEGGLAYDLYHNNADVSGTGAKFTESRLTTIDYLITNYEFSTCFVFLNPSAIGRIRNQFFDPFTVSTWITCCVSGIMFCIFIKVSMSFGNEDNDGRGSWSMSSLNTLAAFCQQDIETDEKSISNRILVLTLMINSMMLYNYYTSSIVSDLINSREPAFTTLKALAQSSIGLGLEKIGYMERLLNVTTDPELQYLRDKRIFVPQNVYYVAKEGIEKVKSGSFAYHIESSIAYDLILKLFNGPEICDLYEIFVFKPIKLYFIMRKKSQYREMFMISSRKMKEFGIVDREMKVWVTKKPACLSSANVLQIELEQMAPGFFVLLFGVVFALIILIVEMYVQKRYENVKKKNVIIQVAVSID